MSRENKMEVDSLRRKLEEQSLQLQEDLHKVSEAERALEEERKSVRLQILEAREEVRQRAEITLDELRSERERMRTEFGDALGKKDEELHELKRHMPQAEHVESQVASPAETDVDGQGEREGVATPPPQSEFPTLESTSPLGSATDATAVELQQSAAGAMQAFNLPKLQKFSGEKVNDDDGLRQFVREFERHAQLVGWTGATKKLQYEVHLSGRALRMYESLKNEQRQSYEQARDELTRLLQPVKLDSYRRRQFNSRRQKEGEAVADFGEALQRLMTLSYANHPMEAQLRDKILLGQFEQGLLPKWKRQLKYPLETFEDGLNQARMAEAVEEQLLGGSMISPSPAPLLRQGAVLDRDQHQEGSGGRNGGSRNGSFKQSDTRPQSSIRCYNCQQTGHMSYQCPNSGEITKSAGYRDKKADITCYYCHRRGHYLSECPQLEHKKSSDKKSPDMTQSKKVGTARTTTVRECVYESNESATEESPTNVETLEERLSKARAARDQASHEVQELELLRLQDRLDCPQSTDNPNTISHIGVLHSVSASSNSLPYSRICVEGCLANAMLDTGSSVSIMDEELFVQIARTAALDKSSVKPPPVLLRNFGDGEIHVTSCVPLRLVAEGKAVTEQVYLVPNSRPACLLGITAVKELGLVRFADPVKFQRDGAKSIAGNDEASKVRTVRLITQTRVPGNCGISIVGRAEGLTDNSGCLLFEPNSAWMEEKGLLAEEFVVTSNENGHIAIVLKNTGPLRVDVEEGETIGTVSMCDVAQDVLDPAQTTVPEGVPSANTISQVTNDDRLFKKR